MLVNLSLTNCGVSFRAGLKYLFGKKDLVLLKIRFEWKVHFTFQRQNVCEIFLVLHSSMLSRKTAELENVLNYSLFLGAFQSGRECLIEKIQPLIKATLNHTLTIFLKSDYVISVNI